MDKQRLRELAGINENYGQSDLDNEDIARLDYLITHYLRGGSLDQSDPRTEKIMDAVHRLQGRNFYRLSPEEAKLAHSILTYGSAV